ncbi:hypothetical protein CVT26_002488 [Gymnopilus dilepis]|uniref:Uncharacterized protein n=1 Tax=Gymnopilus dilepis TaxID=231916 RepID=A0A409Y3P8_9AGAR|nr:hypothetical protein CVT26_002488 [Gymnopilus dilepis]
MSSMCGVVQGAVERYRQLPCSFFPLASTTTSSKLSSMGFDHNFVFPGFASRSYFNYMASGFNYF